jgi:hypothetical protein
MNGRYQARETALVLLFFYCLLEGHASGCHGHLSAWENLLLLGLLKMLVLQNIQQLY